MGEENDILRCSTQAQRCESELHNELPMEEDEEDDTEYEDLPDTDEEEEFILLDLLMVDLSKATPEELIKFNRTLEAL